MTAHSAEELGKAAQRAHQQQRIGTQTSRYTRSTLSGVAQSAEQRTVNPLVESSSLSPGATHNTRSQALSAVSHPRRKLPWGPLGAHDRSALVQREGKFFQRKVCRRHAIA